MRGEISWPEGRVKGGRKRGGKGIKDSDGPSCVRTRREFPGSFSSNDRTFPEDVYDRSMGMPAMWTRSIGPPNIC